MGGNAALMTQSFSPLLVHSYTTSVNVLDSNNCPSSDTVTQISVLPYTMFPDIYVW